MLYIDGRMAGSTQVVLPRYEKTEESFLNRKAAVDEIIERVRASMQDVLKPGNHQFFLVVKSKFPNGYGFDINSARKWYRNRYHRRKRDDPGFMERERARGRARYYKRKEKQKK